MYVILQISQVKRVAELTQVKKLVASQQCGTINNANRPRKETASKEAKNTRTTEVTISVFTASPPRPLFQRQKSIAFCNFWFPPKVCVFSLTLKTRCIAQLTKKTRHLTTVSQNRCYCTFAHYVYIIEPKSCFARFWLDLCRRHAFLPACPSARPPCRLVPRPSLSKGQSLGGWRSCVG